MLKTLISIILVTLSLYATSIDDYIDKTKCDQIIDKQLYHICYSYRYKGALSGWITLYGDKVNAVNIKKRPRFYSEKTIPMQYRTKSKDYIHTGYDRGHTIAADADLDYSKKAVRKTYTMANITPQSPQFNRRVYLKLEKYGRLLASKLGKINSITIIDYSNNNKKIKNNITVPTGYFRIYYNNEKNFKKCFYFKNSDEGYREDRLKEHEVGCKVREDFTK